ncbi:hypothetical protein BEP19_06225 [Ammoniphilus oxalaticus]|uniref:DUF4342 domain-containing protein n=2 Tax=Ammoniphilus oxalaticus TaxID=66863 RepID=A0A419SJ81_9BACL|nr:hypothetical protein BEP19_06225 [Ammoniphilus oxalaticus]
MQVDPEAIVEKLSPDRGDRAGTRQKVFNASGKDVFRLVKELTQLSNVIRISIWHKQRNLAKIPVVYGGLAAIFFPFISLFSMISLLALDCRIIVEKRS